MDVIHIILLVLFCVCELAAAFGYDPATRPNGRGIYLGWMGLFFFALDLLILAVK